MISSTVKRRSNTKVGKPAAAPVSAFSSTLQEKPKRGRRTIPDSFLLGARNQWASLLEESWPEIGWPLLQMRQRRTNAIDDLRKALLHLRDKPHNSGLASAFYCESSEIATPADIRRNRIRRGELQGEIIHVRVRLDEIQRSIWEIDAALKSATGSEYTATIEKEIVKRRQAFAQLETDVNQLTADERNLGKKCSDQEAYVYASELLDYIRTPDRYAVKPLNVANALAGLPTMRWRQSHFRCSKMPPQEARLHYRVLNVILKLWKRRPEGPKNFLIEFFKSQLPKLPKKLGYTRDFLLQNWHDLKSAIEVCVTTEHNDAEAPYILTSIFLKAAMGQKSPLEKMLADQEKLS